MSALPGQRAYDARMPEYATDYTGDLSEAEFAEWCVRYAEVHAPVYDWINAQIAKQRGSQ